jgi:hypothetical protein
MAVLIADNDFAGVTGAAAAAIVRGEMLREWWNAFPPVTLIDLPGCRPDAHMQYFFSDLLLDDAPATIMGCVQRSRFPRRAPADGPPTSLGEWIGANFLRQCRWTNRDGTPGGFHYRPVLVLDRGPETMPRRVDENFDLRLNEVGARYEWAVLRLDLKDYIRALPWPLGNLSRWLQWLNREAGYLMFHPNYFSTPYPRPTGCVDEYCFGYAVVPWVVRPTIAAYGAGRFYSAYKEYRFFLEKDGTVSIDVLFLVAPRCTRVFNVLGFDPIFHTVSALDLITLRSTKIAERAHFAVNHYAMGHHGRVHTNLLDGMRAIWEQTNWTIPAARPLDASAALGL